MQVKYIKSTQKPASIHLHHCIAQSLLKSETSGLWGHDGIRDLFQSSSLKKVQATGHRRDIRWDTQPLKCQCISFLSSSTSFFLDFTVPWACESTLRVNWRTSHDIDEELTGVPHGHAERLAWGCEFGRHRGQVSVRRRARRCCYECLWLWLWLWREARCSTHNALDAPDGVWATHAVFTRGRRRALAGSLLSFLGLAAAAGSASRLLRSSSYVCIIFAAASIRATASTACERNERKERKRKVRLAF